MLTAHVVLLSLLAVVSTFLWAGGVESSTYDEAGQPAGPPTCVPVASWAVSVLTVVLVARAVGRRHPGRLAYCLAGTACWVVVPLTWLTVASAASAPEGADWYLVVFLLTPYGWVFLVPALLIGTAWTTVLAGMKTGGQAGNSSPRDPVLALAGVECQTRFWHSGLLSANQVGTVRHRRVDARESMSPGVVRRGHQPGRAAIKCMEDITTWPR